MALPKMEGQIVIPTGGWTFSYSEVGGAGGPFTGTIPAGTYYLTTTNGATIPLLTAMKNAMENDGNGTYTWALDDNSDGSLGKVTGSATGITSFSITWTSTDLRDVLGFTGNISGSLSYTSTNHARYLHLPNVGRARPMAPEPTSVSYDLGARERLATFAGSPDGRSVRRSLSADRFVDSLEFDYLVGHKTWQPLEVTVNESMERFYRDVIGAGLAFRYHPDRSSDAVYFVQVVRNGDKFQPKPHFPGWVGQYSLWSVAYEMQKAVGE